MKIVRPSELKQLSTLDSKPFCLGTFAPVLIGVCRVSAYRPTV